MSDSLKSVSLACVFLFSQNLLKKIIKSVPNFRQQRKKTCEQLFLNSSFYKYYRYNRFIDKAKKINKIWGIRLFGKRPPKGFFYTFSYLFWIFFLIYLDSVSCIFDDSWPIVNLCFKTLTGTGRIKDVFNLFYRGFWR